MEDVLYNVYEDVDSILTQYSQMNYPKWEDFPDIPLYMDQVIELMERYLQPKSGERAGEEEHSSHSKILTSSMVNNYVKMGIMPAPVKKKYRREHLAYLLMICILKQSLSISVIGLFLEQQIKAMDVATFYNLFISSYTETFDSYLNTMRGINTKAREDVLNSPAGRAQLGIAAAACANAGKLTCETSDLVMRKEVKQAEERKKQQEEAEKEARKAREHEHEKEKHS